jgi:hypothetical protein
LVEPKHKVLRRPAFDIDIEGELLGFVGELIRDAIAIDIDFEASRRFASQMRLHQGGPDSRRAANRGTP